MSENVLSLHSSSFTMYPSASSPVWEGHGGLDDIKQDFREGEWVETGQPRFTWKESQVETGQPGFT